MIEISELWKTTNNWLVGFNNVLQSCYFGRLVSDTRGAPQCEGSVGNIGRPPRRLQHKQSTGSASCSYKRFIAAL